MGESEQMKKNRSFERLNFTVGPVQMDEETWRIGTEHIPYFRTSEFSEVMKENERLLCTFFDAPAGSRAVFMTGSGTASMEGGLLNFFTPQDNVLVVNGGSFGRRFAELCRIHSVPFTEIKVEFGRPLTPEMLSPYENQGYTGFLVQLCETSSGVLFDMNMIGEFCKRNGIFLFVDAVSGFMADDFSMKKMHVNAAITGSQKALALPPGMSFTVLDAEAQKRCAASKVRSMYFNYADYLENGGRGQTPFTPAVGTLLQLNEKLNRIEQSGGIKKQNEVIGKRAEYFRKKIEALPFEMFVDRKNASNCVTALRPKNSAVNARRIFELLKDEYGIWICPNGGEYAEKVFRVGHIGNISAAEIDRLIEAFEDLKKRELL